SVDCDAGSSSVATHIRHRTVHNISSMSQDQRIPYLSAVVCGGEECAERFRDRWTRQAEKHGLSSEVIAVDASRNAAIQRARGEFILVTDVAVHFSDELMQFLAAGRLQKRRLYRIDRHDIADGRTIREYAREGTFALTSDGFRATGPSDIAAADSGIHFE